MINQCLKYLFLKNSPDLIIETLDISGRKKPLLIQNESSGKRLRLITRYQFPGSAFIMPWVNLVYQNYRNRTRLKNDWLPGLKKANRVVMGGGQILMDDRLGFPVKLSGLGRIIMDEALPLHFCACGVGDHWSGTARRLLRPIMQYATNISVRDSLSRQRLNDYVPEVISQVTFDPVIWAAEVYGLPVYSDKQSKQVGLGVMGRDDVNFHLEAGDRFTDQEWLQIWLNLITDLQRFNLDVKIFTTGTPADAVFARTLYGQCLVNGLKKTSLAPRPLTPEDFLSNLSSCGCVVATRLHASITANALGIPSVGLVWDPKISAYYADTQRSDLCFDLPGLDHKRVTSSVINLLNYNRDLNLDEYRERALESARLVLI
ncbi:MAG: polysaccharide pyruvyl transferase family protein [Anaerolineae bacterium]|nr:polysaccharide pyruvyl transferase family protein [Anaerolineae bacterium]